MGPPSASSATATSQDQRRGCAQPNDVTSTVADSYPCGERSRLTCRTKEAGRKVRRDAGRADRGNRTCPESNCRYRQRSSFQRSWGAPPRSVEASGSSTAMTPVDYPSMATRTRPSSSRCSARFEKRREPRRHWLRRRMQAWLRAASLDQRHAGAQGSGVTSSRSSQYR
jgi:hypothetical protein